MKAIGSTGFLIAGIAIVYAQADLAPTGTLRTAYLATNPAQAIRDAHTGEVRGVSFDLARELAKRIGKPLDFKPTASPPMVIDAVRSGQADIGFVAYEATRLGTVEFSQTYMLVQQSFLVLGDSPIHAVADIDRIGQMGLFPDARKIVHCPSGTVLGPGLTIDLIQDDVRYPQIVANAAKLPLASGSADLMLSDPPYTEKDSAI